MHDLHAALLAKLGPQPQPGHSPEMLHSMLVEMEKQKVKDHLKKIRHHEALSEAHALLKQRHKDIQDEQDSMFENK